MSCLDAATLTTRAGPMRVRKPNCAPACFLPHPTRFITARFASLAFGGLASPYSDYLWRSAQYEC
jgi:hypothetical protein